jgi:hypothetical protein
MSEDLYEDLFWEDKKKRTDFKEILFRYLIHWPWIATSLAVCLAAAWLYLRYTPPVYNITASVLIKDDDKSSKSNSLNDLEELGFITSTSNFDNEMEILHSRTLIKKVVEDLDHYISYYAKGRFNEVEKEIFEFVDASTPHMYWLARSFILLSDTYVKLDRKLEARQYLLSLEQNYQADDDIAEMIKSRLEKMKDEQQTVTE